MRWTVFVGREPVERRWHVGQHVFARLVWHDSDPPTPHLRCAAELDSTLVLTPEGDRHVQLVRSGQLVALRDPAGPTCGRIVLTGWLADDIHAGISTSSAPLTRGLVAGIAVVHVLSERGSGRWIRRPDVLRTQPVLSMRDDHPGEIPPDRTFQPAEDDEDIDVDRLVFYTQRQHLLAHGHLLPQRQWQPVGFVVHLDVP